MFAVLPHFADSLPLLSPARLQPVLSFFSLGELAQSGLKAVALLSVEAL